MEQDIILLDKNGRGQRAKIIISEEPEPGPHHYWRLGRTLQRNGQTVHLFQEMEKLTKGANWLFWRLNRLRDEHTNVARLVARDEAERRRIARGYAQLRALGLVIRTKRGHYLLNPEVLAPWEGMGSQVRRAWDHALLDEAYT